MILLLCGLSGVGKTTVAERVSTLLAPLSCKVKLIDGDVYRQNLFSYLGYDTEDRIQNMRNLAYIANQFSQLGAVAIVSAINPYESIRQEIRSRYANVKIVHLHCQLDTLFERDTKGLYRRSRLPDTHPDKLHNLSGVNHDFEIPHSPDLRLDTSHQTLNECAQQLLNLIEEHADITLET